MSEILAYHFLSWFQFLVIALLGVLILFVSDRFHIYRRVSWQSSIGYHMFFCVVFMIVTIAFVAVSPALHLAMLAIVFGLVYKNVFAYVRAIFSLYFSKIHMEDRIRIGDQEGILTGINFGGLHITKETEKTFFSFDNWPIASIILLSEAGRVPVSVSVDDTKDRGRIEALQSIEQRLFEFPFLTTDRVEMVEEGDRFVGKAFVSDAKYRNSLILGIKKAGFNIEKQSKQTL